MSQFVPAGSQQAEVVIYTTRFCPFCIRAKALLDKKQVEYEEFAVDNHPDLRRQMMQKSGRRTVPQIWIGATHVGGCDELFALERSEKLDALLKS